MKGGGSAYRVEGEDGRCDVSAEKHSFEDIWSVSYAKFAIAVAEATILVQPRKLRSRIARLPESPSEIVAIA
jgi:hypothetical protein